MKNYIKSKLYIKTCCNFYVVESENANTASTSSNIKIIDNKYVALQNKKFQSKVGKSIQQLFFSDKGVPIESIEMEEEEEQSKISVDELSQYYIRNKINLTQKSFTL